MPIKKKKGWPKGKPRKKKEPEITMNVVSAVSDNPEPQFTIAVYDLRGEQLLGKIKTHSNTPLSIKFTDDKGRSCIKSFHWRWVIAPQHVAITVDNEDLKLIRTVTGFRSAN